MSGQIHVAAILMREGRVMMVRPGPAEPWVLPGGPLLAEHDDVDGALDAILSSYGVAAPAVEDDFLETVYLPREGGYLVYNVYAPSDWQGEPSAPAGVGATWFAPEELASVEVEEPLRQSLLAMLGLIERPDEGAAIEEALRTAIGGPAGQNAPGGDDVLRTLSGTEPKQARSRLRGQYPELADDVVDFGLDVWAHPALDRKTRSLQVVAMLAALGGRGGPLRSHINGALNHGATAEQLVQTMRMVAVYAGFPAAIEAWPVMEEVFAARGIQRPGALR